MLWKLSRYITYQLFSINLPHVGTWDFIVWTWKSSSTDFLLVWNIDLYIHLYYVKSLFRFAIWSDLPLFWYHLVKAMGWGWDLGPALPWPKFEQKLDSINVSGSNQLDQASHNCQVWGTYYLLLLIKFSAVDWVSALSNSRWGLVYCLNELICCVMLLEAFSFGMC